MPSHTSPTLKSRRQLHEARTVGERAADALATAAGSWKFIIGQTAFIALWIVLNTVAWINHWDPYPWILLNLCMSTQAMYTGPIVLLSGNRQAAKDRARDDLEAREVASLVRMNEQQLEILRLLHQLANGQTPATPPSPQPPAARRDEQPVTPRTPHTSRRSGKVASPPAPSRARGKGASAS